MLVSNNSRLELEKKNNKDLLVISAYDELCLDEVFSRNTLISGILESLNQASFSLINDDDCVNSTSIDVVFRDLNWIFVSWSISDSVIRSLQKISAHKLFLRINLFSVEDRKKPFDFIDFSVNISDASRYILLPNHARLFRADLIFYINGIFDILVLSDIYRTHSYSAILEKSISENKSVSPIYELSEFLPMVDNLLKNHNEMFG